MDTRRILMIAGAMGIGGAEKVARDLGLYCQKNGYQVDYLVFGDMIGEYEKTVIGSGCEVIHIPSPTKGYYRFFHTLRQIMQKNRYDIVHAHTMFNIGWAMLAAKQTGVPIRIAHAHSALNDRASLVKQAYEIVMRVLIRKNATDLIACGNAAGNRLYGERAFRQRGIRILNGIDIDRFAFDQTARQKVRKAYGLEKAFVIGHIGRLNAVKNQAYLIRLLPEIIEKKDNAKLLLLGDGEDQKKISQLIQDNGLSERVIMTGNVNNVSDYLSAMDVFAFPSLYEGMPLSIVEVQANGLPCILSTGVPKDVYLTDLIKPLPLAEPERWTEELCKAVRREPEKYASEIRRQGLDTKAVMQQYMELYERAERY